MKTTNPIRVTLAAAWKDLQVILKDRGLLVVIIVLPSVFSLLLGVVNQRMANQGEGGLSLPVAVVNEDGGLYGQQIVAILEDVEVLEIDTPVSAEAARQQVLDSKVLAAILIPAGLSERVNAYEPSTIEVVIDPTQEQFASVITGILNEVVTPVAVQGELAYGIRTILAESPGFAQADEGSRQALAAQSLAVQMAQVQKMRSEPWVQVKAETQQGEDVVLVPDNLFALITPSFTVLFAFFIVGTMAAELLREKREGSLRRLMAAPLPRWSIIAGKMLAYVGLVILQVLLIFGAANLFFEMPLGNSLAGLLLVTVAMGLAATGLGMLIAALSKTDRQADSIGLVLGFVLGGLGGCFIIDSPVPLYKAGGTIEMISRLTPQAQALMGYDRLLNGGGDVAAVLPNVLALLGLALLFFVIASWRFRFE